jgi:hypothetical protein
MKNVKTNKQKVAEKPEEQTVDVELDDNQLDAVAGGVTGGSGIIGGEDGGGCTPTFPRHKNYSHNS